VVTDWARVVEVVRCKASNHTIKRSACWDLLGVMLTIASGRRWHGAAGSGEGGDKNTQHQHGFRIVRSPNAAVRPALATSSPTLRRPPYDVCFLMLVPTTISDYARVFTLLPGLACRSPSPGSSSFHSHKRTNKRLLTVDGGPGGTSLKLRVQFGTAWRLIFTRLNRSAITVRGRLIHQVHQE